MRAIKQPAEDVTFTYDFTDELGAATIANIVGVPVSVARDGGTNITASGAPTVGSQTVAVKWQGGVDGESYHTTVKVVDTAGDTHERDGEIFVTETGFTLPTGILSRYMTAEEYVTRYGHAETVRLTDEDKTGTVNSAKLEEALKDAADVADSYIGTRYTTPLVDTPRVVKSIVGALARELLHKTRPTPEVKDKAELARSQLRDIAAGRMILPVEQGDEEPVIGGNRLVVTSGDASTTFRDLVSEFSVERSGYAPNWRA